MLRQHKIKLGDIADFTPDQLRQAIGLAPGRAKELVALAAFQRIPSVGPQLARAVVSMGYFSLADLKGKTGIELIDEFETQCGAWQDPCVEDTMRLFAHYAQHPDSDKQWWDFTEERKAYRAAHGYPSTRPTFAWHEAERR